MGWREEMNWAWLEPTLKRAGTLPWLETASLHRQPIMGRMPRVGGWLNAYRSPRASAASR